MSEIFLDRQKYLLLCGISFGYAVFPAWPAQSDSGAPNASVSSPVAPVAAAPQPAANVASGSPSASQDTESQPPQLFVVLSSLNPKGWNVSEVATFRPGAPPTTDDSQLVRPLADALMDPDILKEYGCQSIMRKVYQRGQRRIVVEILQFNNASGAFGAYALLRHGSTTVVARGDGSSEDDQSISFRQANIFVRISGSAEDDDEMKGVERVIADRLGSGIGGNAGLPAVITRLPSLERVKGTEKLVMGPVSARRFCLAPYLTRLNLETMNAAAIADYQVQEPYRERLKLFFIDYGSPITASRAYTSYVGQLEQDHPRLKVDTQQPNCSLFKISGSFLFCQQRGTNVLLVTGARKRQSATMLAESAL